MEHLLIMQAIDRRLKERLHSTNFRLNYGLRNPPRGRGLGISGVEDLTLIERYASALEDTYKLLSQKDWLEPKTDADKKIPVYVFHTSEFLSTDAPFTFVNNGISFIGLRSENGEATTEAKLRRAAIEAVHEASHVFNHRHRPLLENHTKEWRWFDEATAVFMEGQVFPDIPDNLRYSLHWAYRPELSLAHPGWPGGYFAGMFVGYLVQEFGWKFLHDVWHLAKPRERPVDTLTRLLHQQHSKKFCDVAADIEDLFGAKYCIDTFFNHSFATDVFGRYGGRSVAASVSVEQGKPLTEEDSLEVLSCRYYRLYLEGDARSVQIVLKAQGPESHCHLKAALVGVVGDCRQKQQVFLTLNRSRSNAETTCFEGKIPFPLDPQGEIPFPLDPQGHAVLVVANVLVPNAGWSSHPQTAQHYRIEISGI